MSHTEATSLREAAKTSENTSNEGHMLALLTGAIVIAVVPLSSS
jgi:hypothetical protein